MKWKKVRDKIAAETDLIQFTPPDDVLKIFRYGIIDSQAGSWGQNFTTMVFAEGDCRALAYYNANNLLIVAEEESFTLEHLIIMAKLYLPLGPEFLSYCGLKKIWEFAQDVLGALDTLESKDDYRELINSFNTYVAVVHGWIHHYFPWNLGELYPQKTKSEVKKFMELAGGLPD